MNLVFSTAFLLQILFGTVTALLAKKLKKNPYLLFAFGYYIGPISPLFLFLSPLLKLFFFKYILRKHLPKAPSQKTTTAETTIDVTPKDPPTEAQSFWYYLNEQNKQEGPMSLQALQRKKREGIIATTTYIWNETLPQWQRFQEVFPAEIVL